MLLYLEMLAHNDVSGCVPAHISIKCDSKKRNSVSSCLRGKIGIFSRRVRCSDSMTSILHAQYDTFECSHAYCPDVK